MSAWGMRLALYFSPLERRRRNLAKLKICVDEMVQIRAQMEAGKNSNQPVNVVRRARAVAARGRRLSEKLSEEWMSK